MNRKLLLLASVGLFLVTAPVSQVFSMTDTKSGTVMVENKVMTDADVNQAVKDVLAKDAEFTVISRDVNVNTVNGVTTLGGKVDNAKAKADIEKRVVKIDGVKKVVNNIQVIDKK
jgi:osmotically-inducible protein OsmY